VKFLNHYAFLVGIDNYDHFPDLRGAYSDATTLRDALLWVGYPKDNLRLVPPEKTSLGSLQEEFNGFLAGAHAKPGLKPHIVIFWAGHGVLSVDGSFLLAQRTVGDLANCCESALSLRWILNRCNHQDKASLTMFFDVCHSIPPDQNEVMESPKERILAPMRDEVRTTFVGVSTFAHEVWVWDKAHPDGGRLIGILADAVQKAVRGEPCDSDDQESCHESDFTVTDRRLVHKLADAVERKARVAGVYQRLSVLAHHNGTPRKVGFAVRGFAQTELNKLRLPVATDLLARLAVERSGPTTEHMTDFGIRITQLTRRLVDGSFTTEDFLREEWRLTYKTILELQADRQLGPYSYFLLHCREEAQGDEAAKKVLRNFYKYLISGDWREELAGWLDDQYQMFAFRQALPWSCGIRVLDDDDEHGYAPIIYQGAPIAIGCDVQRTFVTTASLQRKARLEVWRADATTLTISDLPQENLCYSDSTFGDFSVKVPIGGRVWVRLGLDEQGCKESCPIHSTSDYVSMKILLGRERNLLTPALRQARCPRCDGPAADHEWCGHWHLDFGEGWNEFPEPQGPEPQPPWVARLRALMDDCRRSLETLLADDQGSHQQEQDDATTLIKWLYLADVVTRMWDESRLEYLLQELIIGLRIKKDQSAQRLARALHDAMSGQPDDRRDSAGDQARERAHRLSAEEVLTAYDRWRITSGGTRDVAIRTDLMAQLLRAVTAQESVTRPAVERLVELLITIGPEEENQVLADAVAVATPSEPARAKQAVAGFANTVKDLLQAENINLFPEQRAVLERSAQVAGQALQLDQPEEVLEEFLEHLRKLIGMGTWVLVTAYLNSTGLRLGSQPELEALVARLRLGDEKLATRQAAEETYRRLQQLHTSRLRDEAGLEEGTDILLIFHALLWPGHAAFVVQLGTRDVDRNTASRIADALTDPDRPDLIDMIRADPHGGKIIRRMALMGSAQRILKALRIRRTATAEAEQPAGTQPPRRAQPQPRKKAGWHDPTLLAVPPGERLGRSAPVSGDT
jgi:hypothetical protein